MKIIQIINGPEGKVLGLNENNSAVCEWDFDTATWKVWARDTTTEANGAFIED